MGVARMSARASRLPALRARDRRRSWISGTSALSRAGSPASTEATTIVSPLTAPRLLRNATPSLCRKSPSRRSTDSPCVRAPRKTSTCTVTRASAAVVTAPTHVKGRALGRTGMPASASSPAPGAGPPSFSPTGAPSTIGSGVRLLPLGFGLGLEPPALGLAPVSPCSFVSSMTASLAAPAVLVTPPLHNGDRELAVVLARLQCPGPVPGRRGATTRPRVAVVLQPAADRRRPADDPAAARGRGHDLGQRPRPFGRRCAGRLGGRRDRRQRPQRAGGRRMAVGASRRCASGGPGGGLAVLTLW